MARAARARAEAEDVLELCRGEHELALAHYRQVERDADDLLARYDRDHAKRQSEQERRKEERIRWALRQPRNAIVQLPVHWQQEAHQRYDKLQNPEGVVTEKWIGAQMRRLRAELRGEPAERGWE